MCNKLKLMRTEDGWHLPHFTYQRCGIIVILPNSVVANSTIAFNVPSAHQTSTPIKLRQGTGLYGSFLMDRL
jgi:hypothetical protein